MERPLRAKFARIGIEAGKPFPLDKLTAGQKEELENGVKRGIEKAVVKIEIPTIYKKEVLRDLQQMNMNRASLFPDLDGYAASLKLRYDSMKAPGEALEQNIRKLEDDNYPFFP